MKEYTLDRIKTEFENKQCLECNDGILIYQGNGDFQGWINYYVCSNCKVRYEFIGSDMGQSLPSLKSFSPDENKPQ